jgi:hypothetical protein
MFIYNLINCIASVEYFEEIVELTISESSISNQKRQIRTDICELYYKYINI